MFAGAGASNKVEGALDDGRCMCYMAGGDVSPGRELLGLPAGANQHRTRTTTR